VELVVLSYSDLSHEEVMEKASKALALGADFMLLGPKSTMLRSNRKVVAVTATKTGAGKSTVSRYIVRLLRQLGLKPVVVRHPMPYGVLERQAVQRFEKTEDLELRGCTVEEREEFEPHLRMGTVVYAGVDYGEVVKRAGEEADVIVWDGGNNDFPFIVPDLHITVVDATRPPSQFKTYPGEVNLLMADVVVINKADRAERTQLDELSQAVRGLNPRAELVYTASQLIVEEVESLRGRRVCVVEDGPTVTHGGLSVGAAYTAAVSAGAIIVDPKPYAVGAIKQAYLDYPHIGPVVPAIGYTESQLRDLEETLGRIDCDAVISSSPADLTQLIRVGKPVHRVWYEAVETGGRSLLDILRAFGFYR
jgi:predicted GTPase